jgi:transposase-like protein
MPPDIDERTIELITERVVAALRDELEAVALSVGSVNGSRPPLTVEEVAQRFGVARSTVYAHWRDWGGYKLGSGDRAPIRFDENALPVRPKRALSDPEPKQVVKRRRRRDLLNDNPKSVHALDFAP